LHVFISKETKLNKRKSPYDLLKTAKEKHEAQLGLIGTLVSMRQTPALRSTVYYFGVAGNGNLNCYRGCWAAGLDSHHELYPF